MAAQLVLVGGGTMGSALLEGLFSAGRLSVAETIVVEPVQERRAVLAERFEGLLCVSALELDQVDANTGAILAVKPEMAEGALRATGAAGIHRVLSIVAGLPTQRLEAVLPDGAVVVRAMPNTPSLVGAGVSAISGGSHATAADLAVAEELLGSVGIVVRVAGRPLDAVTGFSSSGPAYLFLIAEALIDAAVSAGLPHGVARTLVVQTMVGSAKLLDESGEDPAVLRAQVTSPGGTTAAGLRALEARAVRSAFVEAVLSAVERARTLGR